MKKRIKVALAGNPNSGKSTVFNNLTGARQHVGNYPGVTVEKKEGTLTRGDTEILIVDLPGTYSLTAYSKEEMIARDFILNEKPDVVVDILDASNLERNLYLTTQFIELGVPLVLALNMSDVAKARGIAFDLDQLSDFFGAPVIPLVGHKNRGTDDLVSAILSVASGENRRPQVKLTYGKELEKEIARIQPLLERPESGIGKYDPRWTALKLLEYDKDVLEKAGSPEILSAVEDATKRLQKIFGDDPEVFIADRRYGFISGACQEAVRSTVEARHNFSDKIDDIVTNRVLAIPIFLGLMYLVFELTFTVGEPIMGLLESLFGWLGESVTMLWPKGAESILQSLLVDGVLGGVGGVLVFLPNILLLFLAIAILEDSGYMARAAFIMDRLMHRIGLHGKSFIPMLIGFGCSVPAIMATRMLENERDRLTTMMVTPLMSCGARLPIYALIIPAFFPDALRAPILWIIYIIGIVLAVLAAKLLRSTVFKGESTPFVMELPPYRVPTLWGVFIHMWERGWLYLKKAGTIILGISVLLWVLTSFPGKESFDQDYETMEAQATQAYLDGVKGLNPDVGLPAGSHLLVSAMKANLDMEALQDRFYESDAGYAKAEKKRDEILDRLGKGDRGKILAAFLDTLATVEKAHAAFAKAVEEGELEEDSSGCLLLEKKRDAELAKAKEANPALYAGVICFRKDVKAPFDEATQERASAQQKEELSYTVAGRIGHALDPLLRPMGFDWRIGTALIGSFAAKEVFVAQMGIVYSVGEADEESAALRGLLKRNYSPLVAFCIMLFCLISAPCMATIAITKRESNSWKWALFQLGGLTALAFVVTTLVYQVGSLLGIGV